MTLFTKRLCFFLTAYLIGQFIGFSITNSIKIYAKCLVQNETILCVRKAKKTFSRKYSTTASRRLDNESLVYPVSQKHYDFIDVLIDNCIKSIKENSFKSWDEKYPVFYAYRIMNNLHYVIEKQVQDRKSQNILAKAIDEKIFDCDTLSTLYLAVAQILDLPLEAVFIPRHVFVRWVLPMSPPINFELTHISGRLISNRNKNFDAFGRHLSKNTIFKKENFLSNNNNDFITAYLKKNISGKSFWQKVLLNEKAFAVKYQ